MHNEFHISIVLCPLLRLPHIPALLNMQYGFVNSALEKLIKRRFGVEKWEEIR